MRDNLRGLREYHQDCYEVRYQTGFETSDNCIRGINRAGWILVQLLL
jgi:hypothetical protein